MENRTTNISFVNVSLKDKPAAAQQPARQPGYARPTLATAAAAANRVSTTAASTYVRAPVPKLKKVLTKKPTATPRKPFVRPHNPFDESMPDHAMHCARCHRSYKKGDEHFFCLIPHVFDSIEYDALVEQFTRKGGEKALEAGRIKSAPCMYAACCKDAMISAAGDVHMPLDMHCYGFHTPFPEEVEDEILTAREAKRSAPQVMKCKIVGGKCVRECLKQTKFPDIIFTDDLD